MRVNGDIIVNDGLERGTQKIILNEWQLIFRIKMMQH